VRKVSAIVPAAGLSRRFGGPNKLLQPWGDSTVVGSVVTVLRECGLPVLVVTGREAELVAETVAPSPTVFNNKFEEGLGTSIACGVQAALESDGYLIVLGDMPSLRADVVRKLLEEFETSAFDSILAPAYADEPDRPGHPVLFSAAYYPLLVSLVGDHGARSIAQANPDKVRIILVPGCLEDIDEPANSTPPFEGRLGGMAGDSHL
jgi:molybdenum cofactor cytidylyltransferase